MYNIEWDVETGGIILRNDSLIDGNEIRPVYPEELRNIGFDEYISIPDGNNGPVMWAIRFNYYYKGINVAKLEDRGCLTKPKIVILEESFVGTELSYLDVGLIIEKNKMLMNQLIQNTLIRIYKAYHELKDQYDKVIVSYSAGKDSVVLLDLVKRALPNEKLTVTWIDTRMEQKKTREMVEKEKQKCKDQGIGFIISRSDVPAVDLWKLIGPPSMKNRWCCSVCKSVPNLLNFRKTFGNESIKTLNYVGVRGGESSNRMKSEFISKDMKHKGSTNVNGIFNWNSAEIFLYHWINNIELNEYYKEGFVRLGCTVCPMANTLNMAVSYMVVPDEMDPYYDVIRDTYRDFFDNEEALNSYINMGDWRLRNGSAGTKYFVDYKEYVLDGYIHIDMKNPKTDWKIWIKTIGVLEKTDGKSPDSDLPEQEYTVNYRGGKYNFFVAENSDVVHVSILESSDNAEFFDKLKKVFRKASSCIGCKSCEANCPFGHLHIKDGIPVIDDGCMHCSTCIHDGHLCPAFESWYKDEDVL